MKSSIYKAAELYGDRLTLKIVKSPLFFLSKACCFFRNEIKLEKRRFKKANISYTEMGL